MPEQRTCAAPDCERRFLVGAGERGVPWNKRYCSDACCRRVHRLRRTARRAVAYSSTVRIDDPRQLRERAVYELVNAALSGADQATLSKVAGLIVTVDRRLERAAR